MSSRCDPTASSGPDGLSLRDKAARLCWVTVHGAVADVPHAANREAYGVDTPAEVVRQHRPGGVVLFSWAGNLQHPAQVARLTGALRAAAGFPLAVAIDEEGGRVGRLPPPATGFPSARAVALAGDARLAARRWRATGAELAALGVTTNLAPVVDLDDASNPVLGERTFAEDPETVAAQAAIAVRSLRAGGVAAVAKHFPGHGATAVDSHEALPVVHLSRAALAPHLEVYERLFATEPPDAVMTAHLLVPALDADHAATVSSAVLTGLLREELGFDGAVLTDSLSMAAMRSLAPDPEVAVAALAAGADVLLMPPDLAGAITAVCRAVSSGRVAEHRLNEALRRATPLLRRSGGDLSRVGAADHRAVAAEIARRARGVSGRREP